MNAKKFDLNIEEILENWDVADGIREIIANALDEQTLTGSEPIRIFQSSKNKWHVRDYGLFAANPFGVSDFEKKPKGIGNVTIPEGENLTFKYRIYIHKGNYEQGKVAERYKEYAGKESL